MTPFEAVYSIPPPNLLSYILSTTKVHVVDEYVRDRSTILRELQHNLNLGRNCMKTQADQHRREVHFQVGDFVYLKFQPYRQSSVTFRGSLKLAPRFFFYPYEILTKVGPMAYHLALPSSSQIHDVFHVSLLRKYLGPKPQATPTLPPISGDSTVLPTPELILDRRIIQKGKYRPQNGSSSQMDRCSDEGHDVGKSMAFF